MLPSRDVPVDPRPRDSEVFLRLPDVLGFLRRSWKLIVGAGLAAGLVVLVVVRFFLPTEFEASATLVVVPPRFSSSLKPGVLTVQAYQQLLESDAVVAHTATRLVEQGVLKEGETAPRIGSELESKIFVSRRAEETALAPIIEVLARAPTGAKAVVIANTWAEVFLNLARELSTNSVMPTIGVIEEEFGAARTELSRLEEERLETARSYQQRLDDAAVRWDGKLVGFKKETEDLVAQYQSETRSRMEEFIEGRLLGGLLEDATDSSEGELRRMIQEILNLRIQLAQAPQVLVLERSVTDDALWQAAGLDQGRPVDLRPLLDRRLLSEEVNPVHTGLALQLSRVEIDLGRLPLEQAAKVQGAVSGLERLQLERVSDFSKLLADRALRFDLLRLEKQREVAALGRERDLSLDRLNRDIQHQQKLFNDLAESYNQAKLARAGQNLEDVRLASPALEPLRPRNRQLTLKTLIAIILGGIVGFFAALLREAGD